MTSFYKLYVYTFKHFYFFKMSAVTINVKASIKIAFYVTISKKVHWKRIVSNVITSRLFKSLNYELTIRYARYSVTITVSLSSRCLLRLATIMFTLKQQKLQVYYLIFSHLFKIEKNIFFFNLISGKLEHKDTNGMLCWTNFLLHNKFIYT
jgi:hypothetical protein